MATITADEYLDDNVRTIGETFTLQGGSLTVRTDTRFHAGAPSGANWGRGSIGSVSGNRYYPNSNFIVDATKVRWMPYNGGSGVSPAIGTLITQGSVSGYYLGAWANLTSAPVAAGVNIPAVGFIKFREVTGGAFAAGALAGISATATGPDVTGWIELVAPILSTHTYYRDQKFDSNGDWFYLDDTDGTLGQIVQTPTNGGGAGTSCPGLWVETNPGTNEYEFWNGTLVGWQISDTGQSKNYTDIRQTIVKCADNGQMVFGEDTTISGTYVATELNGTYTWAGDVLTVAVVTNGVYLDDMVRLRFTSGDLNGQVLTLPVDRIGSTTTHYYNYPGSGIGGNVSITHKARLTFATAHTLYPGRYVELNYTSGPGTSGDYFIYTIAATPFLYFDVGYWDAPGNGNVTVKLRIGRVPPAGCKTRIPNIILRQCTAGTEATNNVPHATTTSRPDFATGNGGSMYLRYTYGDWYIFAVSGTNYFVAEHSATFTNFYLNLVIRKFYFDDVGVGTHVALNSRVIYITYCMGGGEIKNSNIVKTTTNASNIGALEIAGTNNVLVENCKIGSTNKSGGNVNAIYNWYDSACNIFRNNKLLNGALYNIYNSDDTIIENNDFCHGYIGEKESYVNWSAVNLGYSKRILVDGITYGYNNTILNNAMNYVIYGCPGIKYLTVRNVGSLTDPIISPRRFKIAYLLYGYLNYEADDVLMQRCYMSENAGTTTPTIYPYYSWDRFVAENVGVVTPTAVTNHIANNARYKGLRALGSTGVNVATCDSYFADFFTGDTTGEIVFMGSNRQFSDLITLTGSSRFDGSAQFVLPVIGDTVTIEMDYFALGHIGFQQPIQASFLPTVITGSNYNNLDFHYQIDTGSGWGVERALRFYRAGCYIVNGSSTATIADMTGITVGDYIYYTSSGLQNGVQVQSIDGPNTVTLSMPATVTRNNVIFYFTHAPAEVVDPAIGFKMRLICKCRVSRVDNCWSVCRAYTTSTFEAQRDGLYPLKNPVDLYISFSLNVPTMSQAAVYPHVDTGVVRANVDGVYNLTSSNPNVVVPATVTVVDSSGDFDITYLGEGESTITATYSYSETTAVTGSEYRERVGTIKPIPVIKSKMLAGSPDTVNFVVNTNKAGTAYITIEPPIIDLPESVEIDETLTANIQGEILSAGVANISLVLDGYLLDVSEITVEAIPTLMKSGPPQTYQVFLS
jgi:hypothetical protein